MALGARHVTLEPCVEYQFRIIAENEDSRNGPPKGVVDGETKYFETKCKPLIQSVTTSELKPNSVVLNAEVNPQETETTYHFEYDTREYKEGEAAHGTSVPAQPASIGSGAAFVKVSDAVVNLVPGQTYYFRTAAKNVSGEVASPGQSFRTPVDWELKGKLLTVGTQIKSEGTVALEDRGLRTEVECAVKGEGTVGTLGTGEVSKMTGPKGESVVSCGLVKKGECEGTTAEVEATGLPWNTELVDEPVKNEKGEAVRDEVRDRFYRTGSAGWVVKCKDVLGEKGVAKDTCVGEVSGNVENVVVGVPVEFDAKSPHLTCSGTGGKEAVGVLEGGLVIASTTEGATLSVFGASNGPSAPAVVTNAATSVTSTGATLNGTVAARGAATTYQFEYGTSTGYGSKIPVSAASAGEGRLRVAEAQTLTGLATSTVYHYRLTATNSGGTSYGEDKTFTTGYPARWLYNGKSAESKKTKAEGTVLLEDRGLRTVLECTVREEGEIFFEKEGSISKVTGPKGESVVSCGVVKKGECGGTTAEVEATGLPWSTELVDEPVKNEKGEVVRDEVRDRFYRTGSAGWVVKCKDALGEKGVAKDTCGVKCRVMSKTWWWGCRSNSMRSRRT